MANKDNPTKRAKLLIVTGVITFMYCVVPIIQFHVFNTIGDRFNHHYIFVFSMKPFELMEFIYTNTIIPYISQSIVWLFYWLVCYGALGLFKRTK